MPSYRAAAIDFAPIAIQKQFFALSSNGARTASPDCGECLPLLYGRNLPVGLFWRETGWELSPFTSRASEKTCFLARS